MLDLTFRFFAIAKVHECDLCHCPPRVTRFRTRSLRICGFLVVLLAPCHGLNDLWTLGSPAWAC